MNTVANPRLVSKSNRQPQRAKGSNFQVGGTNQPARATEIRLRRAILSIKNNQKKQLKSLQKV